MTRFRSNIRRGARLALAVVFIFAFGDISGSGAQATPALTPSQPVADTASSGDLAAFSAGSPPPSRDASEAEPRRADPCSICAAIDTANSILFAPPPLLLLPQLIELLYQATDAEFMHLKSFNLTTRSATPPAS